MYADQRADSDPDSSNIVHEKCHLQTQRFPSTGKYLIPVPVVIFGSNFNVLCGKDFFFRYIPYQITEFEFQKNHCDQAARNWQSWFLVGFIDVIIPSTCSARGASVSGS
jgi:hypothetical protein